MDQIPQPAVFGENQLYKDANQSPAWGVKGNRFEGNRDGQQNPTVSVTVYRYYSWIPGERSLSASSLCLILDLERCPRALFQTEAFSVVFFQSYYRRTRKSRNGRKLSNSHAKGTVFFFLALRWFLENTSFLETHPTQWDQRH
uniref:Uncharacterized protein n=1 Tax=Toxoplasma gondii COUG TaxID=1074873 RepID=A0A2G8Y675_TOXGO|nr:hypothetical protein TGCOUG_392460 [Toxoplasma gondii COUG]